MESTAQHSHADRSLAELGRTLLGRLDHGIRELRRRVDQKLHQAGDFIIQKFLVEFDHDKHKFFLSYYDGVAKVGDVGTTSLFLAGLVAPSHVASIVLLAGAALGVGVAVGRSLMRATAETILKSRHPMEREKAYDPKTLPDFRHADYPAEQIRSAKNNLAAIDQSLEIFRIALKVPVVKDFESQYGKESPDDRAYYAFLAINKHSMFRTTIDNLRERMVETLELVQVAMKYLQKVPDSEAKRHVLKELQNRVDQLMPFGDMVNHKGTDRFYRQDLLDLSGQLNRLAAAIPGPAVAARPSPNPQSTAADDRMAAPTATNRRIRP
jgi:hypothetical protein